MLLLKEDNIIVDATMKKVNNHPYEEDHYSVCLHINLMINGKLKNSDCYSWVREITKEEFEKDKQNYYLLEIEDRYFSYEYNPHLVVLKTLMDLWYNMNHVEIIKTIKNELIQWQIKFDITGGI